VVTKLSPRSVPETVARLVMAVEVHGMKVFAVIDHSSEAESVGLELRDTKAVIFGSPPAGTPVMVAAGDQTKVSYTSPRCFAARYALADRLASRLAGIDARELQASTPSGGPPGTRGE
jgi:endonuclease YncB( thermonuclease family)